MSDDSKTVIIEGADLVFRNFSGKEGQYNKAGDRNFSVFLDEKTAEAMLKDGWNVKGLVSREEDEPDRPYIQVTVGYKNRPPRIVMITSTARTHLTEDAVEILDWADIETCDLIIRPYNWEVNGKSGVKAYLQSMFITIQEDELERKYAVNAGGDE